LIMLLLIFFNPFAWPCYFLLEFLYFAFTQENADIGSH